MNLAKKHKRTEPYLNELESSKKLNTYRGSSKLTAMK